MERGLRSEDMAPTLAVAVAVDGDMDMEGRKEGRDG